MKCYKEPEQGFSAGFIPGRAVVGRTGLERACFTCRQEIFRQGRLQEVQGLRLNIFSSSAAPSFTPVGLP